MCHPQKLAPAAPRQRRRWIRRELKLAPLHMVQAEPGSRRRGPQLHRSAAARGRDARPAAASRLVLLSRVARPRSLPWAPRRSFSPATDLAAAVDAISQGRTRTIASCDYIVYAMLRSPYCGYARPRARRPYIVICISMHAHGQCPEPSDLQGPGRAGQTTPPGRVFSGNGLQPLLAPHHCPPWGVLLKLRITSANVKICPRTYPASPRTWSEPSW